jgi:tRNA pseudouridine13 synthase
VNVLKHRPSTELPYLTADLPGIGGLVKQRVEDFRVEELPLRRPEGRGRHTCFRVTKRGLSTPAAVDRIARFLGVRPGEIGFAGLKDAQAVTSQWMSLEHDDLRRLERFRDKQVRIGDICWIGQKLRVGQLDGNSFIVRIRRVGKSQLAAAARIMDVLVRRGVPNYFGAQRFGVRDDNAMLGEALLRGRLDEFLGIYLGRPREGDSADIFAARSAFEQGRHEQALRLWPRQLDHERRVLAGFLRRRRPEDAMAVIDKRLTRLYISAFQSAIFNEVLARRIEKIDQVLKGDLAERADSGELFLVHDPAAPKDAVRDFRISPTGPLVGYDGPMAQGRPGEIEQDVLKRHGVSLEMFRDDEPLKVVGSRRPLRFRPADTALRAGSDRHGPFIELAFTAPPGCYATVLLEEICKSRLAAADAR